MKHNQMAFFLILVAITASATVRTSQADEAADHAALQSLVEEYEAAIQKADPSALKPFLAPEFTGVMVTGEEVKGFEALEAYWTKIQKLLGNGGKYSVKVEIAGPATIVGDFAYAHGTTQDTVVTSAGKQYAFQGMWTAICRRDNDSWKITRIQGSMDAITNAFVTSMLKASAVSSGLTGGAIGFLLGAFALWVLGRRRQPKTA